MCRPFFLDPIEVFIFKTHAICCSMVQFEFVLNFHGFSLFWRISMKKLCRSLCLLALATLVTLPLTSNAASAATPSLPGVAAPAAVPSSPASGQHKRHRRHRRHRK